MHDNLMETLRALIGPDAVLDAAEVAQRSAGAMRQDHLVAQALVRPRNTDELASVMRLCHAQGISVVTQGGLTGLVHGADAAPESVIVSMERMRTIEDINPRERTATVQAGVVLQALQEAVDPLGLIFPLDLGARGSATLGGNAATNAGGNRVIRYGMMRDMVLGLEVVLADGTVLSSMNRLIKNNTGYDLKQLFIGSEGTLGIITRLVLRLFPRPVGICTAFCALPDYAAVLNFLTRARGKLGGALSAFEVYRRVYRDVVTPVKVAQLLILRDDRPRSLLRCCKEV